MFRKAQQGPGTVGRGGEAGGPPGGERAQGNTEPWRHACHGVVLYRGHVLAVYPPCPPVTGDSSQGQPAPGPGDRPPLGAVGPGSGSDPRSQCARDGTGTDLGVWAAAPQHAAGKRVTLLTAAERGGGAVWEGAESPGFQGVAGGARPRDLPRVACAPGLACGPLSPIMNLWSCLLLMTTVGGSSQLKMGFFSIFPVDVYETWGAGVDGTPAVPRCHGKPRPRGFCTRPPGTAHDMSQAESQGALLARLPGQLGCFIPASPLKRQIRERISPC